jgi:hypothetical protein
MSWSQVHSGTCDHQTGVGVLAADRQSTSSGYRASLWDPWPDFILLFFFRPDKYLILLSKASSLTRKRVCRLQCNHSLVPITILYSLIWDCVPFLSPLTTRRDYGGSILTRLHTGYHQTQRNRTYMNQIQHILSECVKKNIKRTPHAWGLAPMVTYHFTGRVHNIRILSKWKTKLKRRIPCSTNIKAYNFQLNQHWTD